jgi:hypothetical protein
LYYFKARYYDPDTGRFLNQDSYLGEAQTQPSLHRYRYAYGNPTVWAAPTRNYNEGGHHSTFMIATRPGYSVEDEAQIAVYAVTFGFNIRASIENLGPGFFESEIKNADAVWVEAGQQLLIFFQGRMDKDTTLSSSQHMVLPYNEFTNKEISFLENEYSYSPYCLTELHFSNDAIGNHCPESKAEAEVDLHFETIEPGKLEEKIASYGSEKETKWSEGQRPG